MGLLDFFTKGGSQSVQPISNVQQGATPQDDGSVNPASDDLSQYNSYATQFSDVKYPLPSTNVPTTFDASQVQGQTLPGVTTDVAPEAPAIEPPDITSFDYTNAPAQQTAIEQQNVYTSVNDAGIKVSTYEPIQPSTSLTPSDPNLNRNEIVNPTTDMSIDNAVMPSLSESNIFPTTVVEPVSIVEPILETIVPEVTPQVQQQPETTNVLQQLQIVDTASSESSAVDIPTPVEVPAESTLPVSTEIIQQPEATIEPPSVENPEEVQEGTSDIQFGVEATSVNEDPKTDSTESSLKEEVTEPLVEDKIEASIEENKVSEIETMPSSENKFKVFKKIGLLGLNTDNMDTTTSEMLKVFLTLLMKSIDEIVVDSNKGYGSEIGNLVSGSNIKLTGIYLRPFYSSYTDESDAIVSTSNYTAVVYSDFIEKIKHMVKESDIFIMPEVKGINNTSELFALWNIENIYLGHHKPIVLLGSGWEETVNKLKELFGLKDSELQSVSICKTPEEAFNLIIKLDSEYQGKISSNAQKIIDKRDEDSEQGYFLN